MRDDDRKRLGMDGEKSEHLRSTGEAGEPTQGTPSREGGCRATEAIEGEMARQQRSRTVATKLGRIATVARRRRGEALTTLAHHIDLDFLREAHRLTRKDGAVGVDGQTAAEYAKNLDENLSDLLERFRSGTYRPPPVRRVEIPKGNGKTRPIGIPTFEDKILQRAVTMVLSAVYEQEFRRCSYGFRPRRSAHEALDDLWVELMARRGGVVLDVDIEAFFDSLNHRRLRDFLDLRVRDGVIRTTIDRWLRAGVLEDGRVRRPTEGTPQGGVISPLLANIYLHHVLDVWFEDEIKPRLKGQADLTRYADDFVIILDDEDDARRVMAVLPKRFGKYGLTLHPTKTRMVDFARPPSRRDDDDDHHPRTFNLLGFTHYWSRSRGGSWIVKRSTAKERMRRALGAIREFCRRAMHWPLRDQHAALCKKLKGHDGYYGLTGNSPSLKEFRYWVNRIWRWALNRRSQNRHMPWGRFNALLKTHPLPPPVVVKSVYRHAARP